MKKKLTKRVAKPTPVYVDEYATGATPMGKSDYHTKKVYTQNDLHTAQETALREKEEAEDPYQVMLGLHKRRDDIQERVGMLKQNLEQAQSALKQNTRDLNEAIETMRLILVEVADD